MNQEQTGCYMKKVKEVITVFNHCGLSKGLIFRKFPKTLWNGTISRNCVDEN
jgi:hypothetical protein